MKFLKIAKWEFKTSITSKKFLMIFFLQLSVLILMIIFLSSFLANMESEGGVTLSPSINRFTNLDIIDNSDLFTHNLNHEVLNIGTLNYNESINRLKQGETTAFLFVPPDFANNIIKGEPTTINLFVNYKDPRRSVVMEEVNSTAKILASTISSKLVNSIVHEKNTSEPSVKEEKKGESLPLQLIKKVMIIILLFFPLFFFGNVVIDSIVGEKERKTGEILIAMPISHSQIIIGKSAAIILTIAVQVAMWMIVLIGAGFEIKNLILVYLMIVLTAIPIIGITSVVATYSKNYKEAGIGMSFVYIGIVGFLVLPTLAYISNKTTLSNISPMTLAMRLFSGENVTLPEFLLSMLFIVIISLISYKIAIKLFKRDDIIFGPRPGIIRLFFELMGVKKVFK